ncbi:MAG: hypothetical protein A9183_03025 [Dehalococcoides mccartyi]|uniref:phage portal protein n=1 Tax=Dehalococcoides mccartyi TaxID=61435 RepID=UPI000805B356|nr:phage portal protein [Dehalococcoides mccartyi]OBW61091.1 MAG: hypothetical protein A9183_03025 [Dehalococcoides mccartyi]
MSLWTRFKSVGDALWATSKVGFGPGEPLSPAAPSEQPRRTDYQVGRNMLVSPRASESRSVTFSQMRQLARIHGVLRTVIEKRKDELKGLEWTIAIKPEFMGKGYESEAKEALKFFEKPDLENTFDQWLGMLTEDLFVIDAPCLFKERDRLGNLRSLQVIDGSTILVLVDDRGRVPAPPQMAYEQIIKGQPRTGYIKPTKNYTGYDELYYRPYNTSSDGVYGFSHVESIIMTVNIALRRDTTFLEWFRSGNIPQALIPAPELWTPQQVIEFQETFDNYMKGDLGNRSGLHFTPGGTGQAQMLQQLTFDGLFDEWLARIICARFGVSPSPYVRMVNRATAETMEEASVEESLVPMMQHLKSWFDQVLSDDMGKPYLQFIWVPGQSYNKNNADMDSSMLEHGIKTIDDLREAQGLKPYPNGQGSVPMVWTGGGPQKLSDILTYNYQPTEITNSLLPPDQFRLSTGDETPNPFELSIKAVRDEISDWERFTLNRLGKKPTRVFETKSIPANILREITDSLVSAITPEAVKTVFNDARNNLNRRRTPAVGIELDDLIAQYEAKLKGGMLKAKELVKPSDDSI